MTFTDLDYISSSKEAQEPFTPDIFGYTTSICKRTHRFFWMRQTLSFLPNRDASDMIDVRFTMADLGKAQYGVK